MMIKRMNQVHTTLGDLIEALYDQAEKVTAVKSVQTIIVTLALLDLRRTLAKNPRPVVAKTARKAA